MLPVSLSSENTTEDLKWTSSEASGRVCSKCSELWQASGGMDKAGGHFEHFKRQQYAYYLVTLL